MGRIITLELDAESKENAADCDCENCDFICDTPCLAPRCWEIAIAQNWDVGCDGCLDILNGVHLFEGGTDSEVICDHSNNTPGNCSWCWNSGAPQSCDGSPFTLRCIRHFLVLSVSGTIGFNARFRLEWRGLSGSQSDCSSLSVQNFGAWESDILTDEDECLAPVLLKFDFHNLCPNCHCGGLNDLTAVPVSCPDPE